MRRATHIAIVSALVAAGCARHQDTPARPPAMQAQPHIEATLALPPCAAPNTCAHVLVVPTGYFESTRCVVAVGPNGSAAVSCAPKDLDIPPDTTNP